MTASIGVAPAPRVAPRRSRLDTGTTPGKLRALLGLLVILSLAWGVLAALTAYQHASAASNVVAVSEPLTLDAEQIYQNLSDANATAANAFLAGGLEPAAARQRYEADISRAALRIEAASAMEGASAARTTAPATLTGKSTATGDDLAFLSANLPLYTGQMETARADNRLGIPLGAAYLREASTLLQGSLLPGSQRQSTLLDAASSIDANENALLTSASAQATGLPLMIISIIVGLAICYVLVRTARWLARHTHRVINGGLALALVVAVVSVAWLAGAYAVGRTELLHAQQNGSGPAEAFARADVAALEAHADESLTLIDNSGDDSYQAAFGTLKQQLGPGPGTLLAAVRAAPGVSAAHAQAAAAAAAAWYSAHAALRKSDDGGDHVMAVNSALSGAAATQFAALSTALSDGIAADQAVFAANAKSGRNAFTGLAIGMIVASLAMVAGCAWGLVRRLAEYR
jgi:hypothetical protein